MNSEQLANPVNKPVTYVVCGKENDGSKKKIDKKYIDSLIEFSKNSEKLRGWMPDYILFLQHGVIVTKK